MIKPLYIFVGMAIATLGILVARSHDHWADLPAYATEATGEDAGRDVYGRVVEGIRTGLAIAQGVMVNAAPKDGNPASSMQAAAEQRPEVPGQAAGIQPQPDTSNDQQDDGGRVRLKVDDVQRQLTLLQTELGRATKSG